MRERERERERERYRERKRERERERERERGRKHCFVNFCLLEALEFSMDEGWWGWAESLI